MADEAADQIVAYYTNLLIIQYHNQPKAQATIAALIRELTSSAVMLDVRDGYDLETAVGHQLDILGKYIGIDRFYEGQILDGYFAFTNYNEVVIPDTKRGFDDYTDFPSNNGRFLTYHDVLGVGLRLGDDDYRFILKLKILQNNIDHSHKSIDDGIYLFFGDSIRADSPGNMVMYYFVPVAETEIIKVAIQKKVLPRPMGVRLNYYIPVVDDIPFFAFTTYTEVEPMYGTGFTDYADFGIKQGQTITYDKLLTGEE